MEFRKIHHRDEPVVTLLSYYTKNRNSTKIYGGDCSVVSTTKKSDKFFLKHFRRRSKSASHRDRLTKSHLDISYRANGERARNPDRTRDKVTLLSFSKNPLETDDSLSKPSFASLKTLREVKMEREREREKTFVFSKLSSESRDWFNKRRSETLLAQKKFHEQHIHPSLFQNIPLIIKSENTNSFRKISPESSSIPLESYSSEESIQLKRSSSSCSSSGFSSMSSSDLIKRHREFTNAILDGGKISFSKFPLFDKELSSYSNGPSLFQKTVNLKDSNRKGGEEPGKLLKDESTESYSRIISQEVHHNSSSYANSETESEDEDDDDLHNNSSLFETSNTKNKVRPISAVPSEFSDISASHEDEKSLEINGNLLEKSHRVALELLSTEDQYVRILHLIDQVFHHRVDLIAQQNSISPDLLPQMFSNVKSIYKFHADFLLPQLRERMDTWNESQKRIGDIFVKFSPFLKMYTEYIKNFSHAINTINSLYNKNSKFAAIMDEIHAMPECYHLTLQHHMLTPIQRIPRYEMLIKDYLKKLPEDSEDRSDSEKALHLVSTAASHANDAMKRIENFKKLLEIQENVSGALDLVSPTRELVKEGKIIKISARSGDHQERYLFLFSDLLILCSPRPMTNRVISNGTASFRLRARFDVHKMQIVEGDNLVTANSFYIRDQHKSVELYTQTVEEKEHWLETLIQTIKNLYQKKSSLRVNRETLRPLDDEIGVKQPHLLKLESITKCMECSHYFSMMKKKHNCRACGIVVCAKCSNQKVPLAFEANKSSRVCNSCVSILSLTETTASSENILKGSADRVRDSSVLMSGPCLLRTGSLSLSRLLTLYESSFLTSKPLDDSHDNSRKCTRSETERENEEKNSTAFISLEHFSLFSGSELKGDVKVLERDRAFKLSLSGGGGGGSLGSPFKKTYILITSTKEECSRWISALSRLMMTTIISSSKLSLESVSLKDSEAETRLSSSSLSDDDKF